MPQKAKGFIHEFKEFISRGNVIDMAVGIIVGTAFTGIVNSLVNDVIMQFVGWLIGGVSFVDFKYMLPVWNDSEPVYILYGSFIQQVINFLIIAFVVFVMVKLINALRRKKDAAPAQPPQPPAPSKEELLLTEIRDLLKERVK